MGHTVHDLDSRHNSQFFKKIKQSNFFSVHFIANLTTNPNDNSSQLSLDVYYVSITLNLLVLE